MISALDNHGWIKADNPWQSETTMVEEVTGDHILRRATLRQRARIGDMLMERCVEKEIVVDHALVSGIATQIAEIVQKIKLDNSIT